MRLNTMSGEELYIELVNEDKGFKRIFLHIEEEDGEAATFMEKEEAKKLLNALSEMLEKI